MTGASGLVGSWLIRALVERGAHVVAFVRDHNPQSELFRSDLHRQIEMVQGSLEEFLDLERAINESEIDTVFHLGAQTIVGTALRSPLSTFESNIRGSYNLLEACHRHRNLVRRIVIASSDKSYGTSAVLPYTEKMPLCGKSPYDVSKTCTDLLSFSYFETFRLPLAIARCGNIFGGGDLHWSRIVPGTIRSFLKGQAPIIRSDGTFTRDYIYVEDVVQSYLLLAENLENPNVQGEAFNFAPSVPLSVLQMVSAIQNLMDLPHLEPQILYGAEKEIRDQFLNCQKARAILGWAPQFSLDEGLKKTIAWYEVYYSQELLSEHL